MDKNGKRRNGNVIAAILLLLCLSAAFAATSKQIAQLAAMTCFQSMRQSTRQLAREIRQDVLADQDLLELNARMIAEYDSVDSGKTRFLLSRLQEGNQFTRMEILFPDDRVLRADGSYFDGSGLSFEKVSGLGKHISQREQDYDGGMILRTYAPIVKNGETAAMLYGVIELDRLPSLYMEEGFSGQSCFYVFEWESGSYLLDTLHGCLGSVHDLGNRRIKPGYDQEQVIADLAEGKTGRVAYQSETAGEYLYCEYGPVGVNDWVIMYSLPESVALADANKIRLMLSLLAGLEALILIAYFVWQIFRVKKEHREKEAQLERIRYMLEVEEILFNAPRDPAMVEKALEKIAGMLEAESAFFKSPRQESENTPFFWHWKDGEEESPNASAALADRLPELRACFERDGRILPRAFEGFLLENPEEARLLGQYGIRSLMAVPVKNPSHGQSGVLGAVNMRRRRESAELLESVALSFSMAMNNMESFRKIREMGMMDRLTGLKNQNSYQRALESYEKSGDDSLACVYVDADGLHEINNHYGHVSGDQLLRAVAKALRDEFGAEDVYRIGGDEFIAFCRGLDEEQLRRRVCSLERAVADSNYHISAGMELRREVPLVCEMVKQAERKMYEAKRSYYGNRNNRQQVREMNRQLEKTLMEKRDLDAFRAVLSSKYLGVYIVDLGLDAMRSIYIPPYFERAAKKAGGKFSAALGIYVEEKVSPEYREAFLEMLDYDKVEAQLEKGGEPELRYRRTDGVWLLLRIYRSPEAAGPWRECIWTFEYLGVEP